VCIFNTYYIYIYLSIRKCYHSCWSNHVQEPHCGWWNSHCSTVRTIRRSFAKLAYNCSTITGWWFGTFFICPFFHILGIIVPTDYFSEGLKPPTRISLVNMSDVFLVIYFLHYIIFAIGISMYRIPWDFNAGFVLLGDFWILDIGISKLYVVY
jgi:hypothetical protein